MWHLRPPRDPPPFMANAILNFHFDYLTPFLSKSQSRFCSQFRNLNFTAEEITKIADNIHARKAEDE